MNMIYQKDLKYHGNINIYHRSYPFLRERIYKKYQFYVCASLELVIIYYLEHSPLRRYLTLLCFNPFHFAVKLNSGRKAPNMASTASSQS